METNRIILRPWRDDDAYVRVGYMVTIVTITVLSDISAIT